MEILIVPPAGVNLQAFLHKGLKSGQAQGEKATPVPSKVRNDLFQPVLIANNHAVTIDETLREFSPAPFHRSQESPPGNLSTIQG